MANSVYPDQTAPIGAVCSGSTLFASILNSSTMLTIIYSRRLQQTTFSDAFFLGALRVNLPVKKTLSSKYGGGSVKKTMSYHYSSLRAIAPAFDVARCK